MRILHQNLKAGEIKIKVENLDDLWYLSQVVDKGDVVKGQTLRKIRVGEEKDEAVRRTVFISIKVEKSEFHKYSNVLRVGGTIVEGPEDVPKGSFHTFNVEEGTVITIIKDHWLKYQLDRLKEASEVEGPKILVCVFDREDAIFALIKRYGYEILVELKGAVEKKRESAVEVKNFYVEIINQLQDYVKRYEIENVILASPAFWKEELLKNLKDEMLKKKLVLATCSSVDATAINEVLKRDEVKEVLKKDRAAKDLKLVEELMKEISKDGQATYGAKETEDAAVIGAVKTLLITDEYIQNLRESGRYPHLEGLMRTVERNGGDIHIVSIENEAGRRLKGLGGIASLLRYRLKYS